MPLEIDYFAKLVKITTPTVAVLGNDLADFIEDQMASPVGLLSDGDTALKGDIIDPLGKIEDPTNPGVFTQIVIILNSEWQIQFFGGSGYTQISGAKIVGGVSDEVIKATGTAGDVTVLISPVDGAIVAVGSGLDAGQDAKLTAIDTATIYQNKIINNFKEIRKIASTWYLIIYNDGEVSEGSEILRKPLKDSLGNDIDDLTAGVLAAELESTA